MKEIKLLDCTLRDGGYVNDWKFGANNLVSIFERLVSSGVDIIEVGFLDQRRPFDKYRSIMPDTACVDKIYGKVDRRDAMIVGMIDYGTCPIENLQPSSDSYLDGIRVIFKKHLMYEAIAFCRQVKELGYKVFTQAVSITSYTDEELLELVALVNSLCPYAVSMVDTYGLLEKENLLHYFDLMDEHLLPEIGLGYHSHNNFQLAYANCKEILRRNVHRLIVVDATLYGMGKSAGNAPIELLGMHLNEQYQKKYDMCQLLEAIDGNIMRIYQETPWGYNLFFYVAASNHCHPSYVKYLMDKHLLSIKSVNEILEKIKPEKKLLYDEIYIEGLYREYQSIFCNDVDARGRLKDAFKGKKLLIVGPGPSIERESEMVRAFIEREKPVVIAINYIPDVCSVDYVFLSNPRRYVYLANTLKQEKNRAVQIIATSNVTRSYDEFPYVLDNAHLVDPDAEIMDNSFVMLLKALRQEGIKRVDCAGLDGYTQSGENYANPDMEYWFSRRKADELNSYVREYLQQISCSMKVCFLTSSRYEQQEEKA